MCSSDLRSSLNPSPFDPDGNKNTCLIFEQPTQTCTLQKWRRDSTRPSYLKDLLIQDSGSKDGDTLSVDDGPFAPLQRPGHLLLTVHDEGDALLIHAEGHAMPSVEQQNDRDEISYQIISINPSLYWFCSFSY